MNCKYNKIFFKEGIVMGKKKKEHVTFDHMADKRIRINKKSFIKTKTNKNQYKLVLNKRDTIL